jgi:hypothetical protein
MTDYGGNRIDWFWEESPGGGPGQLTGGDGKPIMVVRTKGSTVPFTVVDGTNAVIDPIDTDDCRPFNSFGYWPAWPLASRTGNDWLWEEDPFTRYCYQNFWRDHASHASLLHLKWDDHEHITNAKRTKIMLTGMVDADLAANVNHLIPLARSWEHPPGFSIGGGFSGGSYDKVQRAYRLRRDSAEARQLVLTVNASQISPLYNPALLVENWSDSVSLQLDGRDVPPGTDFKQGIETSAGGVDTLAVWFRAESTSPVSVRIYARDPADIDEDGDADMLDFARLVANWLIDGGYQVPEGDLDGDGMVNFADVALWAR